MGRTLLGIDLDESPVGGLIEGLLSEEDLEKLTDGGREPGDEPPAGDDEPPRKADESAGDATDDDATAVGTDLVDDAVGSDGADGSGSSEAESIPVGTGGDAGNAPWDTPSPEGPEPVPSPGAEHVDDEDGGWRENLRPILLKAAAALVVLAVVAFVAYRYLGKATSVASDKLGSDEEDADSPPTTGAAEADAPEARRRAKSPERDDREEFGDRAVDETVGHAERAAARDEPGAAAEDGEADREADDGDGEPDSVGRPTADSDVGALVGLAALALVAALVRKFGEGREYDPLVDGPADDGDDE
ncbi:hypothetical protein C475_16866 [Halosimplex carlsbadense 2-9-1]|uniref:Uncharacterized protein n=1 Tax=Halosimplex carlsbadense 2-9-1 TaxID=797114 RepID=M0CJH0_9EURY|nr:hypothetical protein [Halosimplex carlsbadense]ELZ22793.1 hypothetical protein C475_16866 [Halosimplex carlsbadense 2-9-1]